jgi:hypothetical protein
MTVPGPEAVERARPAGRLDSYAMSDKSARGGQKARRSKAADQSVLGSLSSTRPSRLARRREDEAPAATATATAERPRNAAKPKAAASKAKRAAASKAKPTAAGKPKTAVAAKPKAAAAKAAAAKPRSSARKGPEAVRPSSPDLGRARTPRQGRAVPPPPPEPERRSGPPSGIELVTTAVQAAGEVAQIGLTVGGQILKRAVRRVPRR